MWELDHKESWVPNNWCFWTVSLEKTLESPWTARRSNQSILKELSPEYSLEGLMLKLKLQHFSILMWRTDSLKKNLMLRRLKEEKGTTEDAWHHQLHGHEFEQTWEMVMDREAAVHGVTKSRTWLSDWTGLTWEGIEVFHVRVWE